MAIERTLSIIKPDATKRNLTGKIVAKFEEAGLRVVASKRIHLTPAQAGELHRQGALSLAYLHLLSLRRFRPLMERAAAQEPEALAAARVDVEESSQVVGEAVAAIHAIAESSTGIARFTSLIDEIALPGRIHGLCHSAANGLSVDLNLPSGIEENLKIAFLHHYIEMDMICINGKKSIHLSDLGLNANLVKNYEQSDVRGFWGDAGVTAPPLAAVQIA